MSEIGENALEGLDISALMSGNEEGKVEGSEPSVMSPALEIKEVDEVPIPSSPSYEGEGEEGKEEEKPIVDTKSIIEIDDQGSPDKEEGTETNDVNSPLRVFAELQREKGLIDYQDDEFEDSEDFLLNKVEETIKTSVEDYKNGLPPEVKYLVDNFEEGVPLHDLINLSSQQQEYDNIPVQAIDEDQELQRALVRDLLYRNGWSQDKINQKIQRYVDSGVLSEEAKDAHSSLQDIQKREKEQYVEQVKQENAKRVNTYNTWLKDLSSHIDSKEEIIKGVKITPKQRQTLYNNITKVDADGKNAILKAREADPEFHLKVAYFATVLNWDLSGMKRTSKTKATRSLVDSLSTRKPSTDSIANEVVDFSIMKKSL